MNLRARDLIAVGAAGVVIVAILATPVTRSLSSGFLPSNLGAIALIAIGWTAWLLRRRPSEPLGQVAIPLVVATIAPLLLEPLRTSDPVIGLSIALALGTATMLPLGWALARTLTEPYRSLLTFFSLALGAAVVFVGALIAFGAMSAGFSVGKFIALVTGAMLTAITAIPGLAASVNRYSLASTQAERTRILPAMELAVAGLTPAIAWVTVFGSGGEIDGLVPLTAWLILVAGAVRFTVEPLVQIATRAGVERDVVIGAMEAERTRIAADVHDDAIQELTLLRWRLDAQHDKESATVVAEVIDHLRAICGDLRLPILDDLGTGPALEWLVTRVGGLTGNVVQLERHDSTRPPANVELVFFRVAQEALANAVRHGLPPVVVRYWTSGTSASLSVDDSGPGIDPTAMERAPSGGHFGLLNMQQRAEQIDALLEVRRWPKGGTKVSLEWRAG